MLRTAALLAIAGLPLAATASIFSFASDNDHTSFTFAGFGSSLVDAADPSDVFTLLIDDDNGGNSPLSFEVEFSASFQIDHVGSMSLFGATWAHNYLIEGSFGFYDDQGAPLLTAEINNALLSAIGTERAWGGSAGIISDDQARTIVNYTWHGPNIPDYGLYTGDGIDPEDAAFTLTALRTAFGSGVGLDADMLPEAEWQSEGSYSGSSNFIPAPGSLALLGLAGLAARRRR